MDHLLREKAPISDLGWEQIDEEATRTLKHYLAARKLVDYNCVGSWQESAANRGRVNSVKSANDGVELHQRIVQPLTEIRVVFELDRKELEAVDRGAPDFDTDPIIKAARDAAAAEDTAVFAGAAELGIRGLASGTTNEVLQCGGSFADLPDKVATALDVLQNVGIAGPYGIAMAPDVWTGVMEFAAQGGYPLIRHLRLLLDGPIVWSPAMTGAVILSQRGGDFEIVGGQDWSIGFLHYDRDTVTLYLEESFTALVNTPEAAVRLDFS